MMTFLVIYVLIIGTCFIVGLCTYANEGLYNTASFGYKYPFLYPSTVYFDTQLNVFGVILVYILYVVTNPLCALITFLYYITHTGRKIGGHK